jgi:NADH-quinone oxidoreductase subunit G
MLTPFMHAPATDYADVLLPTAPFTETSGTFVNCEGRVQSFKGVCRPLGDSRPAWKVLRVLGNLVDVPGFDYDASEEARDEIIAPGSEFAMGLDNGLDLAIAATAAPAAQGATGALQRIADVPIHFADPLVRRSAALQQTRDAAPPAARMSAATLKALAIESGTPVRVRQGQGEALLTAVADETVPAGCVRVAAAHETTAGLADMSGSINVERA